MAHNKIFILIFASVIIFTYSFSSAFTEIKIEKQNTGEEQLIKKINSIEQIKQNNHNQFSYKLNAQMSDDSLSETNMNQNQFENLLNDTVLRFAILVTVFILILIIGFFVLLYLPLKKSTKIAEDIKDNAEEKFSLFHKYYKIIFPEPKESLPQIKVEFRKIRDQLDIMQTEMKKIISVGSGMENNAEVNDLYNPLMMQILDLLNKIKTLLPDQQRLIREKINNTMLHYYNMKSLKSDNLLKNINQNINEKKEKLSEIETDITENLPDTPNVLINKVKAEIIDIIKEVVDESDFSKIAEQSLLDSLSAISKGIDTKDRINSKPHPRIAELEETAAKLKENNNYWSNEVTTLTKKLQTLSANYKKLKAENENLKKRLGQ